MPFIPAVNTARVTFEFVTNAGLYGVNVQHFRFDGGGSVSLAAMNDLATAIQNAFTSDINAVMPNTLWLSSLHIRDLTTEFSFVQDYGMFTSNAGGSVSALLPFQNTISIKTGTGLAGRSFRGRFYFCGLVEQGVIANLVDEDDVDAILAAYNVLMQEVESAGWPWVVASYYSNGAPRSTATLTAINALSVVDRVVDRQKRRGKNPS